MNGVEQKDRGNRVMHDGGIAVCPWTPYLLLVLVVDIGPPRPQYPMDLSCRNRVSVYSFLELAQHYEARLSGLHGARWYMSIAELIY